ncbi:Replicase polyprotein 1ab [Bienertia sinuspersici]
MSVIMLLLFRTPLRKLVIMGLDRMKRGRGPIVISTVGGTILVLLASSIASIVNIQQRESEPGSGVINPTDQILFTRSLLDTSLMGMLFFNFLCFDCFLFIFFLLQLAFSFAVSYVLGFVAILNFCLFLIWLLLLLLFFWSLFLPSLFI